MTSFHIDLDQLDALVSDLDAHERRLEELAHTLEQQMAALRVRWSGESAEAHARAHREWSAAMAAMQAALVELHAAARRAHAEYADAAGANVALWRVVAP